MSEVRLGVSHVGGPNPHPNPAPRPGPRWQRGRSQTRAPVARKLCFIAPGGEGLGSWGVVAHKKSPVSDRAWRRWRGGGRGRRAGDAVAQIQRMPSNGFQLVLPFTLSR
ncbi:hypothetical protein XarbCFBP8149_20555 [Xanthomonas arboricola]|nr:hypothetical protein XarbCFBP8149_20555 [Xanthomonas arboricola]PPU44781.1 hypothetical protein XarbCFBP7697_02470 [Xanthomonas arboricola]